MKFARRVLDLCVPRETSISCICVTEGKYVKQMMVACPRNPKISMKDNLKKMVTMNHCSVPVSSSDKRKRGILITASEQTEDNGKEHALEKQEGSTVKFASQPVL